MPPDRFSTIAARMQELRKNAVPSDFAWMHHRFGGIPPGTVILALGQRSDREEFAHRVAHTAVGARRPVLVLSPLESSAITRAKVMMYPRGAGIWGATLPEIPETDAAIWQEIEVETNLGVWGCDSTSVRAERNALPDAPHLTVVLDADLDPSGATQLCDAVGGPSGPSMSSLTTGLPSRLRRLARSSPTVVLVTLAACRDDVPHEWLDVADVVVDREATVEIDDLENSFPGSGSGPDFAASTAPSVESLWSPSAVRERLFRIYARAQRVHLHDAMQAPARTAAARVRFKVESVQRMMTAGGRNWAQGVASSIDEGAPTRISFTIDPQVYIAGPLAQLCPGAEVDALAVVDVTHDKLLVTAYDVPGRAEP